MNKVYILFKNVDCAGCGNDTIINVFSDEENTKKELDILKKFHKRGYDLATQYLGLRDKSEEFKLNFDKIRIIAGKRIKLWFDSLSSEDKQYFDSNYLTEKYDDEKWYDCCPGYHSYEYYIQEIDVL